MVPGQKSHKTFQTWSKRIQKYPKTILHNYRADGCPEKQFGSCISLACFIDLSDPRFRANFIWSFFGRHLWCAKNEALHPRPRDEGKNTHENTILNTGWGLREKSSGKPHVSWLKATAAMVSGRFSRKKPSKILIIFGIHKVAPHS